MSKFFNEETIIGYDFQGWPINKMSFREILEELKFKHEDGKYYFEDTNPMLDKYPITLEDDGMGYGVNEKFITEANMLGDEIHIFIEKVHPDKENGK